ncbi:NusA-like transcription termination signal-binding factor [Candidatus Bathyarchaeota archaeon]|nr:MAG: NusA-like transcription termination signal-binding factor [Candidatus Bathyarchaeota archaeon]
MTSKIRLTADEIRYMALFESITGVAARDCIIDNHSNKITFITNKNEAGIAVGKNGSKIKLLRKTTGRNIEIIEYADNVQDFIKNAFVPVRVKEVRVVEKLDSKKIAIVRVEEKDKGLAIGKGGEKVGRVRQLLKRYFDINNLIIT